MKTFRRLKNNCVSKIYVRENASNFVPGKAIWHTARNIYIYMYILCLDVSAIWPGRPLYHSDFAASALQGLRKHHLVQRWLLILWRILVLETMSPPAVCVLRLRCITSAFPGGGGRFNVHGVFMDAVECFSFSSLYHLNSTAVPGVVVVQLPQTPEDDLRSARAVRGRRMSCCCCCC